MCGYCIEAAVVLDFVESEISCKVVDLENNWVSIYLQESKKFPEIISKLKIFENFPSTIDIAFCRIWEMLLCGEYDEINKLTTNEYDVESINNFLVKLKNNCENKKWESLGDNKLYIENGAWEQFACNVSELIENSELTLEGYYNWWVLGVNKETSDPKDRMEETGIMNPIEDSTPTDWDKFYNTFPFVYFSFLVLTKYQNNSNILKKIALESPRNVPNFLGYDLWLQRKAFTTCVKEYGVQFILENYRDIRFELIYYSLLQNSITMVGLGVLKEHLLSHDHWVDGIDTDSVVQLINRAQLSSKASWAGSSRSGQG